VVATLLALRKCPREHFKAINAETISIFRRMRVFYLFLFFRLNLADECDTSCADRAACDAKADAFPHGFVLNQNEGTYLVDRPNKELKAKCAVGSSVYESSHAIRTLMIDQPILDKKIVTGSFATHCFNATVSGTCPLFHALDNSEFHDCYVECNNSEPAIEIKGRNVIINNVNVAPNKFLARAIDNYYIDIGNVQISNSHGVIVFGNVGGTSLIQVACRENETFDTLVVTQRTANALQPTKCSQLSLDAVLSPLGVQYEIDYLYRNAEVNPKNEMMRWGLFLYGLLLVVLLLYTFVTREAQIRKIILGFKFFEIRTALDAFS